MRTTTYECDRCGKKDTTNKMKQVILQVEWGDYHHQYGKQEWCEECVDAFGLRKPPRKAEAGVAPPPALRVTAVSRRGAVEYLFPLETALVSESLKVTARC